MTTIDIGVQVNGFFLSLFKGARTISVSVFSNYAIMMMMMIMIMMMMMMTTMIIMMMTMIMMMMTMMMVMKRMQRCIGGLAAESWQRLSVENR